MGGIRARGASRAARRRNPRGQQCPRHRHRPAGGQADAGGPARPRACPDDVRGRRLPRLRARARHVDLRTAQALAAALVAVAADGGRSRTSRAQPHRWLDVEPSPGPRRPAAADILRAAVDGASPEPLNVRIASAKVRLRAPFVTAWGSVTERELVVLELSDPDGTVGFGEAAPLPGYDGVSVAVVRAALEDCCSVLERDGTLAECAEMTVLPQALAAVDLAQWDLRGRRAGQPVWRLLGAESAPAIEVNYTIGASDRAGAAAEAGAARA